MLIEAHLPLDIQKIRHTLSDRQTYLFIYQDDPLPSQQTISTYLHTRAYPRRTGLKCNGETALTKTHKRRQRTTL